MVQINMNPYIADEMKQRQAELIRQSELIRMAEAGRKETSSTPSMSSMLLARFGKKLVAVGAGIEARYGKQSESKPVYANKGNPENCY